MNILKVLSRKISHFPIDLVLGTFWVPQDHLGLAQFRLIVNTCIANCKNFLKCVTSNLFP